MIFISEDEGCDDEEIEDEQEGEGDMSEQDEDVKARYVDATAPEEIHVRVERKFDEKDDEFNREFEKLVADSIQIASHQPRQPVVDLTVPPSVRQ
ncbi:hypothetical protein FO519_010794, partial [Halicephalobus sp. NKZ332]